MITFTFNGIELFARAGQSVSAALLTNDERITRYTRINGAPRGIFCGIGICFDCLLIIDGHPNQRGCITVVQSGMTVELQNDH